MSQQLEKELQQQQSELADKDAQLQRYDAAAQQLRQENSRLDQSISERDATIQYVRVYILKLTHLLALIGGWIFYKICILNACVWFGSMVHFSR